MRTCRNCSRSWSDPAPIDARALAAPREQLCGPRNETMNTELNSRAGRSHARLDVMNYLNEIAGRHPTAISLASGRPAEAFFDFEQWLRGVPDFVAHQARELGLPARNAFDLLAQYGRTNGIINDL